MRYVTTFLLIILFIPLISADTTFFDNPEDSFIMGNNSINGEVITEGTTSRTTGGTFKCLYNWSCTDWGECSQKGKQTRNCINIGTCPNNFRVPEMTRNCFFYLEITGEIIEKDIKNKNFFSWIMLGLFSLIILFFILRFVKKKKKRLKNK